MPKAYSLDLRKRAIALLNNKTKKEVANIFNISERTITYWLLKLKTDGNLEPLKQAPKNSYKINRKDISDYLKNNPDKTLAEIAETFNVSINGVWYNLRKLGYTFKKNSFYTKKEMKKNDKNSYKS